MKTRKLLTQTAAFISMLLFATSVWAQGSSSIRGTVFDSKGAVVPGATVTLKSDDRNFSRTQTANESGAYVFTSIPPGRYRLEVESQGFRKTTVTDVIAEVDTPLTQDVTLEIGAVTGEVTVTAGTDAALNTTDATIGNTFNQQQISTLPLNARNVVGLLSLQTGVTQGGEVNGARSDQANVTLDGVDVNEQQGGRAFFSVLRATPDSLQEFRVTTTNANADTGRSSGAQIALVTKSGTNEFHGSLYEYHRNTVTSANDWFNNKAGVPREGLLRHNFGGSLGGPIIKDRFFFFFNYEGFRQASSTTVVREVPLATLGQGIVRYRSANGANGAGCPAGTPAGVTCLTRAQISAGYLAANGIDPGTNPAALSVLAGAASRYTVNDSTVGDGLNTGGFRFNASTPNRQNTYIGKFDYNLTTNQTVFARLNYQSDTQTLVRRFPDTVAPTLWVHPKGVAFGHNWTISNNKVNRLTYGLTRDAFTQSGDSTQNSVNFRFIYQPLAFSRTLSRTTPVHNLIDDFSWIKGNHTMSLGGNARFIKNSRVSFGSSFDNAATNPSFYDFSGDVVLTDDNGNSIFSNVASGSATDLRDALTAVIGRFSQYGVNLQYGKDGSLLGPGTGIKRDFATQEYELYGQDSWRIKSNLTLTYGLRWSTSTPVYESNGLQVKPTTSLSDFFANRVQGAFNGRPFNDLLSVDLAGKANDRSGYYKQDFNNFAPSIGVSWSPNFKEGFLKTLFGGPNKSTFRGGFRMTYDRIGSALAVAFDLNSTLGFSSARSIAANTYNVSTNLGPLFTGFGQNYRTLPGISIANRLQFPLQTPADEDQRIEQSLDDRLTTPYNYSFNFSYARDLGKGYTFETSYVGRIGRNLLVSRDTAHFNNLRDPASGQDFYSVIRQLVDFRNRDAAITSIPNIPWIQRFLPGLAGTFNVLGVSTPLTASQAAYRRIARTAVGGRNTTDYTFVQLLWDDGLGFGNNLFIQPQYATFAAYSTIGTSDYNSFQLSFRKRYTKDFQFDVNYTLGHSLDIASGTETSGAISSGASLILNPLDLNENRGDSDFDVRHIVNANFIYSLPFGKGKFFFGDSNKVVNTLLGGWQLTGIMRYNTGLPAGQPFDDARWATNWNVQSNAVALRTLSSSPTRTGDPNLFSDPTEAFRSYRNALPGEAGDRNILRDPSFFTMDAGLYKSFLLPREKGKIIFRWEVFNVTNSQQFTNIASFGLPVDPFRGGTPAADFGRFTGTQGSPRIMQFALRYEF